jgi:hypothetical protein
MDQPESSESLRSWFVTANPMGVKRFEKFPVKFSRGNLLAKYQTLCVALIQSSYL